MTEKTRNLNFNLDSEDRRRLDAICERLSLSRSEIARRALRLGLSEFDNVEIPGSRQPTTASTK